MKVLKKVSIGADFVDKKNDIHDGDLVILKDEGTVIEGKFGEQTVFKIELVNSQVKAMSLNQTSMNMLIDEYGDETEKWIGTQVKISIIKQSVSGKLLNVVYVSPVNYEMGEDGWSKVEAL